MAGNPTSFGDNMAIAQQGARDTAENMANAQQYRANEFQIQQAQQQAETQKNFNTDLQQANGDPAALQQLALKYPGQAKQIGEALGIKDQQRAMQVNSAVGDFKLAASIGTDQAMAGAISKHRDLLSTMGSSGQEMFQMWKQNPQQFNAVISAAGMSTIPYQKQQELDAQNYRTDATMRGQNLQFETAGLNRQVTREGQQIQREGQQITRETNELSRENTRQTMQAKRAEQGTAAQAAVDAWNQQNDALNRNMSTVTNAVGALNADGTINTSTPEYSDFAKGFGASGWVQRNIPGTVAANTWANIKAMQAGARQFGLEGLRGLGAASDADAAAAQSAFLAIDDKADAATAKRATERYIAVLNKYRSNNNSPAKLAQVAKARTTAWAASRNVNPSDAATFMQEADKGNIEQAKREWAQVYPGIEPPKAEDF